ncbi:MAG TPA: AAA family ATPase [Clostridia bacterium]|nr:AAA family ATPase [Clostridia bacterium]
MCAASCIMFSKVEIGSIFTHDFRNFLNNNTICFSEQGVAVVYGPNGTGKTSFINVISGKQGSSFVADYLGAQYTSNSEDLFYIISDQNHRNIISGTAKDFFLGANIQREFELADLLANTREKFITALIEQSKAEFNISSASSKALEILNDSEVKQFLSSCLNKQNRGKNYDARKIVELIMTRKARSVSDIDQNKWSYFTNDINSKESLIRVLFNLPLDQVVTNPQIHEIEENSEALRILEKFPTKTQCIVCDNKKIDCKNLIEKKTANREAVIASINEGVRNLALQVIQLTGINDPFQIKGHLMSALDTGNVSIIVDLQTEFSQYVNLYNDRIINLLNTLLESDSMVAYVEEYYQLIRERPTISDEDMMYVEEIISNSMDKELKIDRDENNTIKLHLENNDFLGKDRDTLPLSAGEQNFLSLAFEFLKAKNSNCQIVVLDDPISSFDSIYKNKIAYAIMKILPEKKRIILTHNIDLLRLLESQYGNSYNLYILNNTSGENNGFIALNQNEKGMLINLNTLLDTFRNKIFPYIKDVDAFLMSLIPFCRGYATLINDQESIDLLTNVMHGYKDEKVNIAGIYRKLFKTTSSVMPETLLVDVDDILHKAVEMIKIVDPAEYPLLDRTLKHSLIYLQLRLLVEKTLVERYEIPIKPKMQLGQIINAAFPKDDIESLRYRVQLTSKKTLINEFNHFEGNMSIFQPAIDITNTHLNNEKTKILSIVEAVNARRI